MSCEMPCQVGIEEYAVEDGTLFVKTIHNVRLLFATVSIEYHEQMNDECVSALVLATIENKDDVSSVDFFKFNFKKQEYLALDRITDDDFKEATNILIEIFSSNNVLSFIEKKLESFGFKCFGGISGGMTEGYGIIRAFKYK